MVIKRLYVHERIYDEFLKKQVAFIKSFKVGNSSVERIFIGPIQNLVQFAKAKDLLNSIVVKELKPALGGFLEDSKGYFIHPTIIDNPPESSRVVQEEAFAPILPVMT